MTVSIRHSRHRRSQLTLDTRTSTKASCTWTTKGAAYKFRLFVVLIVMALAFLLSTIRQTRKVRIDQKLTDILNSNTHTDNTLRSRGDCGGSIRHVHISVGVDPSTSMTVSFSSVPSNSPAASGDTRPVGGIQIGMQPDELVQSVLESAPALSYSAYTSRKLTKLHNSPLLHHVTVNGLQPSTRYYYKCFTVPLKQVNQMQSHENGTSITGFTDTIRARRLVARAATYVNSLHCPDPNRIRSFTTAPMPGKGPVKFAVMSALGYFRQSATTLRHFSNNREGIMATIFAGDIAYPGNNPVGWETFFDMHDDISVWDEIPLQVAPGNHDITKWSGSNEIFVAYETRFRMPAVKEASLPPYDRFDGLFENGAMKMMKVPYPLDYEYGNAYYAYTYGLARHIVLSSYSSMEPGSSQYTWLSSELESINRTKTPWVLVTLQNPMYNTFVNHKNDTQSKKARNHFESMLVKHQVNLVFSGHIHCYLRTRNVASNKLDPRGPVHIVTSAAGRESRSFPFQSEHPESWVAVRDGSDYGYGILEIFNSTYAKWDWIRTGYKNASYFGIAQGLNVASDTLGELENRSLPAVEPDSVYLRNQYLVGG